jgi:hypothetical protein
MASSTLFRSNQNATPGITQSKWKSHHGPITLVDFSALEADHVKCEHGNHTNMTVMTSNNKIGSITHLGIDTDITDFMHALDAALGENKRDSWVIIIGNVNFALNKKFHDALAEELKKTYPFRVILGHPNKATTNELPIMATLYRNKVVTTQLVEGAFQPASKPTAGNHIPNKVIRRLSSSELPAFPGLLVDEMVNEIPFPFTRTYRRAKSLPEPVLAQNTKKMGGGH